MTPRLSDAWGHALGAWAYAEKNRLLGRGFGLGLGLVLAGCTIGNPPPPAAGTRAIYVPDPVTVICDRGGNLIYQSDKGLAVLPGGCADTGKP